MSDIFVGRQPIFTKNKEVFAYELLFRGSKEQEVYQAADGNKATAQVLENSLLEFELEKLTKHRPAFINFTAEVLMEKFIELLPTDLVVIELLETVDVTPAIVDRCKKLKALGFQLALDDFVFSPHYKELVALADYIKIDFRATNSRERYELTKRLGRPGLVFLAEKVETQEEYQEAVDAGYDLIQGYFFSKPEVVGGRTAGIAEHEVVLFLQEINKAEFDYRVLEELLRHNVHLAYKFLRLVNSPYFGFRVKINSFRHGLVLVGQENLCKWGSLLLLSSQAVNKSPELIILALTRARFAELISVRLKLNNHKAFFLGGMFSLMDAILNRPMQEVVEKLPVLEEVKEAMLGFPNTLGLVLELVSANEKVDWDRSRLFALGLGLSLAHVAEDYYQAVVWSGRYDNEYI